VAALAHMLDVNGEACVAAAAAMVALAIAGGLPVAVGSGVAKLSGMTVKAATSGVANLVVTATAVAALAAEAIMGYGQSGC
jgi:hypothetical protein